VVNVRRNTHTGQAVPISFPAWAARRIPSPCLPIDALHLGDEDAAGTREACCEHQRKRCQNDRVRGRHSALALTLAAWPPEHSAWAGAGLCPILRRWGAAEARFNIGKPP